MDKRRKAKVKIALLSLCHMGIDFLCAFSLYGSFADRKDAFLLYNFCAFALQMPLGIILDHCGMKAKSDRPGKIFTAAGIVLTIIGSYLSHIIAGIGNAFFHVGAGVLTIEEDDENDFSGKGLGVFVAPGAIGLFLGNVYHATGSYGMIRLIISLALVIVFMPVLLQKDETGNRTHDAMTGSSDLIKVAISCFAVVTLRSLTGMAISFSWKQGIFLSMLAVLCLALGKTAGGFLSAKIGMRKTIILTLAVSAIAYRFGDNVFSGLVALFFFNMTMPLTLYLLSRHLPGMPGFAFGILTFGLFIGYLPVLCGYVRDIPPFPLGTASSLISLILLYIVSDLRSGKDD